MFILLMDNIAGNKEANSIITQLVKLAVFIEYSSSQGLSLDPYLSAFSLREFLRARDRRPLRIEHPLSFRGK